MEQTPFGVPRLDEEGVLDLSVLPLEVPVLDPDGKIDPDVLPAPPARLTVSLKTAALESLVHARGFVTLGKTYRLYRITTDQPARVRLYASTTQRDLDLNRPIGTDPQGDHGLMFEFITTPELLSAVLSPMVDGSTHPADTMVPIAITNLTEQTRQITVSLTYMITEF